MQLIKKQERIAEIAFLSGIVISLLVMIVEYGEWSIPLRGRLLQIAFGLFCVKIAMTFYTKKEWSAVILLGIIGVLSYVCSGDEYAVSVIVMIFASKHVDMRRACKWILGAALIATLITAILSLCGIGGIPVDIRDYGRGGEEARWCFGFGHANNFHGTIWYLTALCVYLFFEKMDWRHYIALTAGNVILFCFTISKGGFIATQLVLVVAWMLYYIKPLTKQTWIYLCGLLALVGVFLISLISVSVESQFLMFLDKLFTGRINLAYQYANISTWKILNSGGELGVVDNGWVTIFYNYGYIVGTIFFLFHLFLIYKMWKDKNGVLLVLVISCVFYTFMESTYTMNNAYLLSNISYIAAMILMAGKKEPKNESEWIKG